VIGDIVEDREVDLADIPIVFKPGSRR